jgi:hypothetical protein
VARMDWDRVRRENMARGSSDFVPWEKSLQELLDEEQERKAAHAARRKALREGNAREVVRVDRGGPSATAWEVPIGGRPVVRVTGRIGAGGRPPRGAGDRSARHTGSTSVTVLPRLRSPRVASASDEVALSQSACVLFDKVANRWRREHRADLASAVRFRRGLAAYPELEVISYKKDAAPAIALAVSADDFVALAASSRARRLGTHPVIELADAAPGHSGLLASGDPSMSASVAPAAPTVIRPTGKCVHGLSMKSCPLCGPNRRQVWITDGGRVFHVDRECAFLNSGQDDVRDRKGVVSPKRRVAPNTTRDDAIWREAVKRKPCEGCVKRRRKR